VKTSGVNKLSFAEIVDSLVTVVAKNEKPPLRWLFNFLHLLPGLCLPPEIKILEQFHLVIYSVYSSRLFNRLIQ